VEYSSTRYEARHNIRAVKISIRTALYAVKCTSEQVLGETYLELAWASRCREMRRSWRPILSGPGISARHSHNHNNNLLQTPHNEHMEALTGRYSACTSLLKSNRYFRLTKPAETSLNSPETPSITLVTCLKEVTCFPGISMKACRLLATSCENYWSDLYKKCYQICICGHSKTG